jgi:hypothetical protein
VDDVGILDVELRGLERELAVVSWRAERLRRLGYARAEAERLAFSSIDIHALEDLVGRGCPLDTAVRIAA